MKIVFLFKALLAMLFAFYTVDFDVSLLPAKFTYREIKPKAEPRQAMVGVESKAYKELKELLTSEQHGWKYDLVSHAGLKVFESNVMRINCYDEGLVINYVDGSGNWVQIVKGIPGKTCPNPLITEETVVAPKN